MRKVVKVLSVSVCATLVAGAAWAGTELKSDLEKRSYAIGVNMVRQLKQRGTDFDAALISKGLSDEATGNSLLTVAETDALMQKLREESQKRMKEELEKTAVENQKRGEAFMVKKAKEDGVKSLPGGMLYKVLKAGDGTKPAGDDIVTCNFNVKVFDGKVFDENKPNEPATFNLRKAVPGLRDALTQMPVGSKWEVVVPGGKAYGVTGLGSTVGPNETLIYELELVSIL